MSFWGVVPGSSLVDAWEEYKKGNYASAALNALFGAADLASAGAMMKVKGGGKFVLAYLKSWIQDAVVDAASNAAGNAVAKELGPEAGIATQIIVSAAFSGDLRSNVSRQNKRHLGFAADGGKKINESYPRTKIPQTIKEVGLPDRIRAAGGSNLRETGEFFGWNPSHVTKGPTDFTRDALLAKGWTKQRLLDVAEGYKHIARITPKNPSAAGRATQLLEIVDKIFGE